jgi:hypothetical protein
LISSRSVECIAASFSVWGGCRCCESKQRAIWRWRTEEREEVNEDLCGKLKSAGGMIDGLFGIVAQDERVGGKGYSAVGTPLVQTAHACQHAMVIIDDEHDSFLFLTSLTVAYTVVGDLREKYTSLA